MGHCRRSAHAGRIVTRHHRIVRVRRRDKIFDAPQMRFLIVDAHVGALLLSGLVGAAVDVAERFLEQARDLPGVAPLLGAAISGRAALGAGRLATAESLLGPVAEALFAAGESDGSAYRYQLPRTIVVALRGRPQMRLRRSTRYSSADIRAGGVWTTRRRSPMLGLPRAWPTLSPPCLLPPCGNRYRQTARSGVGFSTRPRRWLAVAAQAPAFVRPGVAPALPARA